MNPYNNLKLLKIVKDKAKKLPSVKDIRLSKTKNKKIDVITKDNKIIPIGDVRYEDFNIHRDKTRRKNYKNRMEKNRHIKGTAGYFADKLLW